MKHRGTEDTESTLKLSLCSLCLCVSLLLRYHPSSYRFTIRKVGVSYKTDRIAVDHDDRFVLQDVAVLLRCDDLTGLREPQRCTIHCDLENSVLVRGIQTQVTITSDARARTWAADLQRPFLVDSFDARSGNGKRKLVRSENRIFSLLREAIRDGHISAVPIAEREENGKEDLEGDETTDSDLRKLPTHDDAQVCAEPTQQRTLGV